MLTKLRSLARELVPAQYAGNISIDPSAIVAPGVVLLAEGTNRIAIGAGVCIGAGSIVRATGGNLTIGSGVCIGREVLIIGTGSIARDACIGAGTTTLDPQIAEGAVVPPHSVLGDRSRGEVKVVAEVAIPDDLNGASDPDSLTEDVWSTRNKVGTTAHPHYYKAKVTPEPPPPIPENYPEPERSSVTVTTTTAIEHKSTSYVSGRAQFDLLKRALFPHSGNNDEDDTA
jgi:carbon dioxide concentrating mechanism protein CcmN